MTSKTFFDVQLISNDFLDIYKLGFKIEEIVDVNVSKISACDKNVVFPPLDLNETVDSFCLLVRLSSFSEKTCQLPSSIDGLRIYYKLAPQYKFGYGTIVPVG